MGINPIFVASNAGQHALLFGLFLFTATQHIKPLKSYARNGPALDTG